LLLLLVTNARADRFGLEAVDSVSGGPGYEYLGFGFAPLGDLDGDGFGEAALGGLAYYGQPGVVLIEGSRSGVSGVTHARMDAAGDAECCFSPTAGDSDGDGFSDLVVGAWLGDLSGPSWAAVLRGSAGGIEATPSTLLYDPTPVADRSTYGSHLSFVGDLDGDGTDDLGVGVTLYAVDQPGEVLLYAGSASRFSASPDIELTAPTSHASFGDALDAAGDMDGDGADDLVVGNPKRYELTASGVAYVFGDGATPSELAELTVAGVSEEFGSVVAGTGDVNGDGYDDVAIPDPRLCEREAQESKLYVFFGASVIDPAAVQSVACVDAVYDEFASDIDGTGDVDADGYADVVVGNASYGVASARL
jgi:hypothetical protein